MAALQALEDRRVETRVFRQTHMTPNLSQRKVYRECRTAARMCSPDMMWELAYIALDHTEDARVRAFAAVAVLDRAGVRPIDYDPDEEARELHALPLEERKARLRELMDKAGDLLSKSPGRGLKKAD